MEIVRKSKATSWKLAVITMLTGCFVLITGNSHLQSAPSPRPSVGSVETHTGNKAPQVESSVSQVESLPTAGDAAIGSENDPGETSSAGCIPGDADLSGAVGLGDAIYLADYLYREGPAPLCSTEGCGACDEAGALDGIIGFIIRGGAPPISCGFSAQLNQFSNAESVPQTASADVANTVVVGSASVPQGATNVQVGVFITNDFEVTGLVLPLQLRSITAGSYIVPGTFSLTVQGRVASDLASGVIDTSYYTTDPGGSCFSGVSPTPAGFGSSPDAFIWSGFGFAAGLLTGSDGTPGAGTPSFLLEFDVNTTPGQFIIDTACTSPGNSLQFVGGPGCIQPSFTPGIVTIECDWAGCAPGAIPEGEGCAQVEDDFNGGCNSTPPVFSSIQSGDTVCGQLWADTSTRDTDWYRFSLTDTDSVTWSASANAPFTLILLELSDECNIYNELDIDSAEACEAAVVGATMPAGEYVAWVGTTNFDNYPCTSGPWEYQATFDVASETCVDTDGDGISDPGGSVFCAPYDNCPYDFNPAQTDSNGDGVGDACEAPLAGNSVEIESKTVQASETGVTLGISVQNDLDVSNLVMPLIARSLSGGAFWQANLDTLPASGRLTSVLTEIRVLNKANVDYTAPDEFLLVYGKLFDPCMVAGPSEVLTGLTFDVGPNAGQFEIDTALYPPSNILQFADCEVIPNGIYPEFQKGIVTVEAVPSGEVVIESKTVPSGATGVELDISIGNTVDLAIVQIPLIARSLSGGAFWANTVDTLPTQGRLAAGAESHVFNLVELDFVSPDQVRFHYFDFGGVPITAGPLEPMLTMQFDVNANAGQFEIDTMFVSPQGPLEFFDEFASTVPTTFTKGIVTIEPPIGGNYVRVESKQVDPGETDVTLEISVANENDLQALEFALVARSLSGGAFWSGNLDTLHAYGRLTSAMTTLRNFGTANVDYASPDGVGLTYLALFPPPTDVCLASGLLQGMTGLTFNVGTNEGYFEIDTAFVPPATEGGFIECGQSTLLKPTFEKGIVTVGNPPPLCECDCHGDPVCNGVVNVFDVVACVDEAFRSKPPVIDPNPACTASSDNDVAACNGIVNVFDVVAIVDVAFRGADPAVTFCDPCGP